MLQPAVNGDLVRSTGVAETGGLRKLGLSPKLDEEAEKLIKENAGLRNALAEIGAYDGFENVAE